MNTRKLATSVAAIALLGLAGIAGAANTRHHEADQNDATGAQQSGNQVSGNRDPMAEMQKMQAQMDRMFEAAMQDFRSDSFSLPATQEQAVVAEPEVSVQDEDNQYVVKAEIPGSKAEGINVGLDGQLLTISAETRNQQQQRNDQGQVIREEQYDSDFERALTLPGPVTASGMHSDYHDGVLTVTIPKSTS